MGRALNEKWLIRIGCAWKQKDWGVSGLESKGLNSSQGRPKRTDRECRKRHATGNSSIQLFSLTLAFLASFSIHAENPQHRQVGDAFEGMMLNFLYQQMQSNREAWVDKDGPFAPSNGEKIFRSMQEHQMMQALSKSRPLGVSDLVVRQLEGKGGVRTLPQVNYKEGKQLK